MVSPIITSDGRVIGASKIARDITGRKRAEKALLRYAAQLKEADQRKDEFLATLSHELRNPLAPIRNAIGIMKNLGPLEPTLEWCRDLIDQQIALMSRLMEDLLDVSRITQDRLILRKQLTDLHEVINHAVEISQPQIETAEHKLTVDLPGIPLMLDADPVRLANLLNNAAK
jgi:signal transduction histidine kinase